MVGARPGARGATFSADAVPWIAAALVAVVGPTVLAWNLPPSATFFNQALAFVAWGVALTVASAGLARRDVPSGRGAQAVLAAIGLCALASLAAPLRGAPWSLALSAAGTLAIAGVACAVGAAVARTGRATAVFRGFAIALAVAGVLSSAIGLVQVFAPAWPDGAWVAVASIAGRATGNLRQPNHLSSLLLWSIVAFVWLGEARSLHRALALAGAALCLFVVVLSGSRTGALGMVTLALWALLDRRLAGTTRVLLALAPLWYWLSWLAMRWWAATGEVAFGAAKRFDTAGDFSSSRFDIWSNTLALVREHPWLGVGFGEFNFAWTLTPFPGRPIEFFDHSHNLVLNLLAEMGVPLGTLVVALLLVGLWHALRNALADGREPDTEARPYPTQRAAFVVVVLVSVHSMLEYPLWYAYFLLPTAFAFGLCLGRPRAAADASAPAADDAGATRPLVLASMAVVLAGSLAVFDYTRVVTIFSPPAEAEPLEVRIAKGRGSVLFGHHADYAAGTVVQHPGEVLGAFDRSTHFLLDMRLAGAWATALHERGETDKARWVAARMREFRQQSAGFFAPCDDPAVATKPFQCTAPSRAYTVDDFRRQRSPGG
jgi:O-antigen ligase